MWIKLEVGKRYRDGHGNPHPIVMRFSASVYMAHNGAKYSDTGKRLVEYEYDSRLDLIALVRDEAPHPDELAALRDRVVELEQEIAAIRREAETNQKWAFLEWRDRAEAAEAENARLREAAKAYRQAEQDYVFMAERPDEEYVPADVHLARMHMHRAAAALDAALTAKEPK
jgi:hypothetical protein